MISLSDQIHRLRDLAQQHHTLMRRCRSRESQIVLINMIEEEVALLERYGKLPFELFMRIVSAGKGEIGDIEQLCSLYRDVLFYRFRFELTLPLETSTTQSRPEQ
jgi:hypothetical protein